MEILLGLMIPFLGRRRAPLRVPSAGRPETAGAKDTAGICLRGYGGGLSLVAADSGYGYGGDMGRWAFVPAAVGFLLGMGFLLLMDQLIPTCISAVRRRRAPSAS